MASMCHFSVNVGKHAIYHSICHYKRQLLPAVICCGLNSSYINAKLRMLTF